MNEGGPRSNDNPELADPHWYRKSRDLESIYSAYELSTLESEESAYEFIRNEKVFSALEYFMWRRSFRYLKAYDYGRKPTPEAVEIVRAAALDALAKNLSKYIRQLSENSRLSNTAGIYVWDLLDKIARLISVAAKRKAIREAYVRRKEVREVDLPHRGSDNGSARSRTIDDIDDGSNDQIEGKIDIENRRRKEILRAQSFEEFERQRLKNAHLSGLCQYSENMFDAIRSLAILSVDREGKRNYNVIGKVAEDNNVTENQINNYLESLRNTKWPRFVRENPLPWDDQPAPGPLGLTNYSIDFGGLRE